MRKRRGIFAVINRKVACWVKVALAAGRIDERLDAAGDPRLPLDEPCLLERQRGLASRNRHPLILRRWRQAIADARASLPEINPLGFPTASLADSTNKNKVVPSPFRFCLSTSRQSSEPASAV